ncbi:ABC transporter ATP-binding protein [Pusillimonas caeni]|nr:ABC transporter ATP-binding protein [Pusillimonas caeni]
MLDVRDLVVHYGKAPALRGVSLDVGKGEVVALLGANGSGKTTLLNTISGFLVPRAGQVSINARVLTGQPPHVVFREGVAHVSQYRDLFGQLSVRDNLILGAAVKGDRSDTALELVYAKFPRLKERSAQRTITLSGGEQQMLAIGRALMSQPEILLFDEPSAGLAPKFVDEIGRIMQELKEESRTMLLVEQNMRLAMCVADRFYVLRDGQVVAHGTGEELRSDFSELAKRHYL